MMTNTRKSTYELIILETHLDFFGHVNNAVYMQLYEEARWDFITSNGYGLAEIQKYQIGPVIIDAHIRFKRELRNREKIRIESEYFPFEGKIGKIQQKMINEKGEECSSAEFLTCIVNLRERKMISPAPEWLAAIGVLGA